MIAQVFIHKKRVECGGVKACEKHSYYDEEINVLILHSFGQVFIVVLESFTVHPKARSECGIVVVYCLFQKFFGAAVHHRRFKTFILNIAYGMLLFVGSKGEDSGDF